MRKTTFLSPLSIGITIFLFALFGGLAFLRGGELFSPGKVSAKSQPEVILGGFSSHAEFERECERCHLPLETTQNVLCLACHTNIETQITHQRGTHARIESVGQCFECHAEHRGREFDPTETAYAHFDHSLTAFSLNWHAFDYNASPLGCTSCHTMGEDFGVLEYACQDCHQAHDADFMTQHESNFGADCLACHDGLDTMTRFNHRVTKFPLDGGHVQTPCANCHVNGQFQNVSTDCFACHAEPAAHNGLFDPDCSLCHTTISWKPAIMDGTAFDHTENTRFSLNRHPIHFDSSPLTCAECHSEDMRAFKLDDCAGCHGQQDEQFMGEHQTLFGSACLDCHDGVDRFSDFDHALVFALEGRHAELACDICHASQVFRGTPSQCGDCHQEPQIHAGWFGLQCQNCHTATAWAPARMVAHTFPIDHGEDGQLACEVCHESAYVEYVCYGCHEHQPVPMLDLHREAGILEQEITNCAQCHPAGEIETSN